MVKKGVIKKRYLFVIFLVSFIVSFILFNVSASAKTDKKTKIYILPKRTSYPKLGIGDTFEISVKIEDVDNLYAYEFRLKYDSEILEFVDISSSFLSGFKIKKTDESGVIRYAVASMYPAEPKSGDGTLATITFQIKGIGASVLDLYNTKLADYDINWIDHAVKDSYFSNEKDKNEVESEWEENIEASSFENMIQTNMGFSGITYQQSPDCTDFDNDTYNCDGLTVGCGPLDCNDADRYINPGNGEVCNELDDNCNGEVDETCLLGDTTGDCEVNIFDLAKLGKAFGSIEGQARWDRDCDLYGPGGNPDGIINVFDLAMTGKNYGDVCPLGCVDVTVQSNSNPLEGAFVYVNSTYIGKTNSTGQAEKCGRIEPGDYIGDEGIEVYYEGTQFCPNTDLTVDDTGTGSEIVIRKNVTVTVYVEGGTPPYLIWIEDAWGEKVAGPSLSDGSGDFTACLEDGGYIAYAEDPYGIKVPKSFTVPDITSIIITF